MDAPQSLHAVRLHADADADADADAERPPVEGRGE